jgi:anthranilate phosphoribosyltransferase
LFDKPTGALLPYLHAVAARRNLSAADALSAIRAILQGSATDAQIAAFLIALHMKGETSVELAGFARGLRETSLPVPFDRSTNDVLLDTCGTGGDGHRTFNISTTVAFVVAGCGVRVAKHGNRGVSSVSGSADVLERLGVKIAASGEQAALALREAGICFLFAPAFHPQSRQVQSVRRELRMRTVFNLLGPLSNPAVPTAQVVGTPSLDSAGRVAAALAELGLKRGYVVRGEDGLDEVTLSGPTAVFAIANGEVRRMTVEPADFGFERSGLEELRGGAADENARITTRILAGHRGQQRDIVLANAAMGLMAAGKAETPREAVRMAEFSIDSGAAGAKLEHLKIMSHG